MGPPAASETALPGIVLASQIPNHNWRVRLPALGCEGALIVSTVGGWSGWGCATPPPDTNLWPMFAGTAALAADGLSVVLGDNDLSTSHGYTVPRDPHTQIAPDGHMTGSFTPDGRRFAGQITGWGASIVVTLELAD